MTQGNLGRIPRMKGILNRTMSCQMTTTSHHVQSRTWAAATYQGQTLKTIKKSRLNWGTDWCTTWQSISTKHVIGHWHVCRRTKKYWRRADQTKSQTWPNVHNGCLFQDYLAAANSATGDSKNGEDFALGSTKDINAATAKKSK